MTTVPGFGFKIVDRCRSEMEPLVKRALRDRLPLELGLCFGNREAMDFLLERVAGTGLPMAVHLDPRQLSILGIEAQGPLLRKQLALSARLGATRVIAHLSSTPAAPRPDSLFPGLRFIGLLCADHGLDLHIENTHQNLTFHRRLFRGLAASRIGRIHFCFDLGHAKVWSSDSLQDWLGFLADLDDSGLRLHFHLHANRGSSDEHLSFVTAERLGITAADGFTGTVDYYQAMAAIADRFPAAARIFEVPAAEAEANLDHVLKRTAEARAGSRILQQPHGPRRGNRIPDPSFW